MAAQSSPMADLILVFPRLSAKQSAAYLVYHPERRQIMPKLTLLNWKRLEGICRYSVVRLRDHLYFLGGYQPAKKKYSKQVLRYELSTGTWYYCNKMKTPRADFQAFAFDGKIYCPGGRTTNGALTDLMESFEPITNIWFQENQLPVPCAEFACLCLDQLSSVILVGGVARSPNGSYRCFNHVWRFGLLKSSNPYLDYEYLWQPLPSGVYVPTSMGVRGHQLLLDATFNRVYLIGGSPLAGKDDPPPKSRLPGLYYFSVDDLKALLEEIDKEQEQEQQQPGQSDSSSTLSMYWTRRHLEECSRSYAGASLIHNKLFIFGGTPVAKQVAPVVGPSSGNSKEPAEAVLVSGHSEKERRPEGATSEPDATATTSEVPEQVEVASDVGYYDKRRKSYHSLFSLQNSGIDTSEVFSVTVKLEKSNKDLKQDRLDWLLQWSMW